MFLNDRPAGTDEILPIPMNSNHKQGEEHQFKRPNHSIQGLMMTEKEGEEQREMVWSGMNNVYTEEWWRDLRTRCMNGESEMKMEAMRRGRKRGGYCYEERISRILDSQTGEKTKDRQRKSWRIASRDWVEEERGMSWMIRRRYWLRKWKSENS